MKNKYSIIILTFFLIQLISFPANGQTNYLNGSWSDTDFNPGGKFGDWADALDHDLLDIETRIYIKNTKDNVYIALFTVLNETISNIGLVLDSNHDLTLADDMKYVTASNVKTDYYFTSISSLIEDTEDDFSSYVSNIIIGGVSGKFIEFKFPLIPPTSQLLTDPVIIDPSDYLIGFDIVYGFENGSQLSLSQGIRTSFNGDASGFLTIVLASPGRYKTPDFSPPSSSPPTQTQTTASTTETEGGFREGIGGASPGYTIIETLFVLGLSTLLIISFRRRNHK
ncbi:MAG: hypothetical protein HeimC3_29340 [Candidatus Heimdallarchaeota archaeon LC_3]|nr:MAG: hypothetical protein HeimC3_29340 [Candidatus Heimdallarchaeota archaeon LC_3]